ncbi:MAG TPA: RusA family crossover junction endodeoxyribonuclease [Mycobacteriales bacterium]
MTQTQHGLFDTIDTGTTARPGLVIIVRGQPKPKGSLRHIGHGRMKEEVKGSPAWRLAVKDAAVTAAEDAGLTEPLVCPLAVEATITVLKPQSAPKRRETWPITRSSGDIDKHARNLLDALADAGVMRDDSQVIDLHIRKCYPGQHPDALDVRGAVIYLYPIGDTTP